MVQQEVRKKTRRYGTVAVLSATVLVALIFVFGSTPGLTPLTNPPGVSGMKTFADETELRNYLFANSQGTSNYRGSPLDSQFFGEKGMAVPEEASPAPSLASPGVESGSQSDSYSTTNIQVAGVDEADIVKNDGEYIYVASNDYSGVQNYVYILKADPQDPRVIARITLDNNTYLAGMYLSQDSNKLIVIGSEYQVYAMGALSAGAEAMIYPYRSEVETFLNVYDVSDKVHPVLARNFTLSGSYFNSRMIGDYVYAVVSQPAYILENNVLPLPRVYADTAVAEVPPSKIYYSDTAKYDAANNYFTYTTFIGLNVKDSRQELTNMTVLMGGASTMYVSLSNIYVTYPTWSENGEYTSIYRISVNKDSLAFEAKGSVPGYVLNQYSMDEYNGNFRLATTSFKDTTMNGVYVLNSNLTEAGEVRLENAEIRETIQSVRFMGDKAYVVTFEQKDPFFVLDMSNPSAPKVAGKLEIQGFSSYLHPYDENHIIGLGTENGSVKLSLFDVTNVNSPIEIAKYNVQADYSSSDAQYEPKAFLFDKTKQLLVIPVSLQMFGPIYSGAVDPSGKQLGFSTQGYFWQGAYVFKLTATGGFELRGAITQLENTTNQKPYPMYGIDYNLFVQRALYIGNTLYTVSNGEVKLNSLTDLSQIAEVKLS
jgi:inhibitor of cysteine peptidase